MAQYDNRNLAPTIHGVARHRLPCTVGFAIDPWANGGRKWTWCHQWVASTKRPVGEYQPTLGRCVNCHKTLAETLYPPKPPKAEKQRKTNRPAYDAASMGALQAAIESGR